ncbi:MAG TPA: NADH-quinone oxidoreductase subunit C [Ktedonobacterales bacterium]
MDIAPRAAGATGAPSLLAYDRDHINELLNALAQLDEQAGQPTPKRRLNAGIVGIEIAPERLVATARFLRDSLGFEMLTSISGVDMIEHLEAAYHFRSISQNWLVQVRVKTSSDDPQIPSLVGLYTSANWLERETYDLFGIRFIGHPDLRRMLLDDEFEGHPLRKNFVTTPTVVHDRATTQVDAIRAVSGEQQRRQERVVLKRLGQGQQERIHPGMTTFGSEAVFLETGQGVGTDANAMHGYTIDEQYLEDPVMKPQEG